MLQDEELGSDSSDEDYQPGHESEVSEEEGDGDPEDPEPSDVSKPTKKAKRTKKASTQPRKRRMLVLEGEEAAEPNKDEENDQLRKEIQEENQRKKEEDEKKRADDLFADFMKDVSRPKPRPRPAAGGLGSLMSAAGSKPPPKPAPSAPAAARPGKVSVTKVFDFAGEAVTVTKDVEANSREAKRASAAGGASSSPAPQAAVAPRRGGMASLLSSLGKAPKMSVLEKSKLDWQNFKKDEDIEAELDQHKRSKDSYLEKQDFLQRSDLRQFELEKSVRDKHRTPR